ncbi:DUF551 domain-containing protein [Pseudomonas sp. R11F]|uniref:DUF551 domain-containing protein n=1 Tax=Pseudomonas TaxID=286 RepID=UPI00398F5CFB
MSDWIKCSDRLPQERLSVLASASGFHVFNLYLHRGKWLVDGPASTAQQTQEVDFTVTHWQPLPAPPTE